jgi:hypothetical protein
MWNNKYLRQILYYNPKRRKDLEEMDELIKKPVTNLLSSNDDNVQHPVKYVQLFSS